ncbi:PTS sugar transporter subunit IIA [Aeromonas veronii]
MKFKQSLMENNSVLLNAAASEWRGAIKLGTDMLIRSGAVEPRYHDAIIGSIEKMGPYIVIAPSSRCPMQGRRMESIARRLHWSL